MNQGLIATLRSDLAAAGSVQAIDDAYARALDAAAGAPVAPGEAEGLAAAISEHLSGLFRAQQFLYVPPTLPRLLEILGVELPCAGLYRDAERQLNGQAKQRFASPAVFLEFQVNLLLVQSVTEGLDAALAGFIRRLMAAPYGNWMDPKIEQLGAYFIANQWLNGELTRTAAALKAAGASKPQPETVRKLLTLTRVLGFSITAPRRWLELFFGVVIGPAIAGAAKNRMHDAALMLEWAAYVNFTRAKDDADHFRDTVGTWVDPLRRCGKAFGRDLPKLAAPRRDGAPPTVAFFLQNTELLGHTEALLTFLRGVDALDPKPIAPLVYLLGRANPELEAQLAAAGTTAIYIHDLAGEKASKSEQLTAMREDARQRGVTAVVYVSLVLTMPFAFSMPLAPVQIWWSMKYHSLSFPEVDGYMSLGSFDDYREIEGRPWRAVHRALTELYDAGLADEAAAVRSRLLDGDPGPVLGCIGREEKMISDGYIAALAEILDAVPGAVFLWTGKTEHPGVVELLRRHGIEGRCRYVGWIDTRLYAQVIDVFVDSFPFASGLTAFEAMAAARPVVAMITPEALGTGMPGHIWPVYTGAAGTAEIQTDVRDIFTDPDGGSLLPFVTDAETYVKTAIALCTDEAMRGRAGDAMRTFVERYMLDAKRMAASGCRHILEIIDETLGDG